jgi:hypothetical protein
VMNFPMPSWLRFIFFSMFSAYMGFLLNFWNNVQISIIFNAINREISFV